MDLRATLISTPAVSLAQAPICCVDRNPMITANASTECITIESHGIQQWEIPHADSEHQYDKKAYRLTAFHEQDRSSRDGGLQFEKSFRHKNNDVSSHVRARELRTGRASPTGY